MFLVAFKGFISIHALLAESDRRHSGNDRRPVNFYPRSPCGERHDFEPSTTRRFTFLSTLSLRRATVHALKLANTMLFLSTLSLRRATLTAPTLAEYHRDFYPRSPCGERQELDGTITHTFFGFLSTLSLRRATFGSSLCVSVWAFLSTLSLRRATRCQALDISARRISIHALLAESDRTFASLFFGCFYFYPRSPCGERLCILHHLQRQLCISIHALLAESDVPNGNNCADADKFLSTLSLRRATDERCKLSWNNRFLSTLSLRRATAAGRFLLS